MRSGLAGRFHPGLSSARVSASNASALTFALRSHITGVNGWKLISKQNDWFQRFVVDQLARDRAAANLTVFAYSYAAERILTLARERGWRTVLGQVDPGPVEEDIVAQQTPASDSSWQRAPREYWQRWHRECELAHTIVVNSTWSRRALVTAGVNAEKIRVIPLAFEPPAEANGFTRKYPNAFTNERPLRVLFLGQINFRKGAVQLFNAVKRMAGKPVEFWFVGPLQVDVPHEVKDKIKWFGVAPRNDVARYYRDADVFILPTFSDGFGLTQLEAQSWKLPVIATPYCGDVVTNGVNGMIVETVSAETIAGTLHQLLRSPETLQTMSGRDCCC